MFAACQMEPAGASGNELLETFEKGKKNTKVTLPAVLSPILIEGNTTMYVHPNPGHIYKDDLSTN